EEYAVVTRDHLGEVCIELYQRLPAPELRRAEILEPVFRALHAIEILTHDTNGQRPPFFHRSVGRTPCKTLTCACSSQYVARHTATCSDRPFWVALITRGYPERRRGVGESAHRPRGEGCKAEAQRRRRARARGVSRPRVHRPLPGRAAERLEVLGPALP